MTLADFKKLKVGDRVRVDVDTKDAYGEVWDEAGDIVTIKKFTSDGVGVIFTWSDLGVHYSKISQPEKKYFNHSTKVKMSDHTEENELTPSPLFAPGEKKPIEFDMTDIELLEKEKEGCNEKLKSLEKEIYTIKIKQAGQRQRIKAIEKEIEALKQCPAY